MGATQRFFPAKRYCFIGLLILLRVLIPSYALAQSATSRSYTVEHGLPDNNIHCLLQDGRGFIWIGTENGLARFDGSSFRQYRKADGLPDNEVVALRMDSEGRVWVLAYSGAPAVYDVLRDCFVKAGGISGQAGDRSLDALDHGGMAVNAGREVLVYHKGAMQTLAAPSSLVTIAIGADRYLSVAADSFRLFDRYRRISAQPSLLPPNARAAWVNHALYYCDSNGICKTALSGTGAIQQMCAARRTMNTARLSFTGRHLAVISDNGTSAALFDTATLAEVERLPLNGVLAKDVLEDSEGNIWIASIGQGLIRLSRHPIMAYKALLPPDILPTTVAVDGPLLLCGDDKGHVIVFRSGCIERLINVSRWSKAVSRIRSIVVLKEGYYIAVEGDASLLLDKSFNVISVYNRPYLNYSDRCAVLWRDSILLAGSHAGAVRLDYKSCHAYDTAAIRTTAIGADEKGRMIIGSSDGIYRKDGQNLDYLGRQYPELRARVTDICATSDGLVWISMAVNYLVALRDNRIAGIIPFGQGFTGTVCNTLCAGAAGRIWAGTDAGLSRISYKWNGDRLSWQATSFSSAEGIEGQVTDLSCQQDTIYAATSSGVYSLPARLEPKLYNIPVYITGIRINDRDTFLYTSWDLPHSAGDWDIRFAGVSFAGQSSLYQYRINGESWQELAERHLPLNRLAPGTYNIQIRALRRDGTPSASIASLRINLRAPFWRSLLFWIVVFVTMLALSVLALQYFFRRKRERQLRRITAEAELATSQQQTFSALMNPHFIFNALNSIQHYVLAQDKRAANRYLSGFGRLIRMNFESAQKSYISLDEELERLQLYLSLEQMRFGERLTYSIEVAEDVVPEDWQIPAMIIQPYLENALLHGITPASIPGRLELSVSRSGQDLYIRICDNGIGMDASRQSRQGSKHASKSMELIARRVAILRKLHRQDIRIDIGPYHPADLQFPGTCVSMIFPSHFVG